MFDLIKEFVIEHWEALLSLALCVLSFVLAIIRKKPILNKSAVYMNELFQRIPIFIDLVEKDGHGSEKKQTVLELCREYLASEFGFYDFDILKNFVSQYIEDVLTTPQKKKED